MSDARDVRDAEPKPEGRCANEGCGRPARAGLCDACDLERFLFHREIRAGNEGPGDSGRAALGLEVAGRR